MPRDKVDIGSEHIYKKYVNSLDPIEKETGYDIPRYILNRSVHKVNKYLMEDMVFNNNFIRLPYGLGTIGIFKRKPPVYIKTNGQLSLPKDMAATYALWNKDPQAKKDKKFVYHKNSNTGGYVIKTLWQKNGIKVRNITGYKFKTVKGFKRLISKQLKDPLNKLDFYELN